MIHLNLKMEKSPWYIESKYDAVGEMKHFSKQHSNEVCLGWEKE